MAATNVQTSTQPVEIRRTEGLWTALDLSEATMAVAIPPPGFCQRRQLSAGPCGGCRPCAALRGGGAARLLSQPDGSDRDCAVACRRDVLARRTGRQEKTSEHRGAPGRDLTICCGE